jgi:hypothetical protein
MQYCHSYGTNAYYCQLMSLGVSDCIESDGEGQNPTPFFPQLTLAIVRST